MHNYQRFLKRFRVKQFKKGEIILCQGETPDCAYAVKSGIIKTYNLTLQGEEKPIGFDAAPELFPLAWVFGKVERVQYYYEAFTDCELYCLSVPEYMTYLQANPQDMMAMLSQLVDRYVGNQIRLNALTQSKASAKVINTLHFLCLRHGTELKQDTIKIHIPLTQQDLANLIGLTRETTGIELKKLQKQGVLTARKQSIIVHTDKLNNLLDEDYGLGLPLPVVR